MDDGFDLILEYVIEKTGHEPYRELTADGHPDAEGYRRLVRERHKRLIDGTDGKPAYPSIANQLGNAAHAVGRVVGAVVAGQAVLAPPEERQRRQAICDMCPHWNTQDRRCALCGCHQGKLSLAVEECPDKPPRWGRWNES